MWVLLRAYSGMWRVLQYAGHNPPLRRAYHLSGTEIFLAGGEIITRIEKSIIIQCPIERAFAFIKEPDNFARSQPPETETKILTKPEGWPKVGQTSRMSMKAAGQPYEWENEITEVIENQKIAARQKGGPFKKLEWIQTFEPSNGATKFSFITEYELPYSLLGKIIDRLKVEKEVDKSFDYYIKKTKELIERG